MSPPAVSVSKTPRQPKRSTKISAEDLNKILVRVQLLDWLGYEEVAALRRKAVQTVRNCMRPEILDRSIRVRFDGHSPRFNKADLLAAIDAGLFARPRKGHGGRG